MKQGSPRSPSVWSLLCFTNANMPQTAVGHGRCWDGESVGLQVQSFDIVDRATSAGADRFWPHLRPSPWPVRFIVNYGRSQGRQSPVDSYINPVLFMGNYKTPRNFFPTSWDWLWSFCQVLSFFLNLSSHRFLEPWVICSSSSIFLIQDICCD